MATIRELFDTQAHAMTMHAPWGMTTADGAPAGEVIAKVAYDFEANAKYWYFYVSRRNDLSAALAGLFASPEVAACRLGPDGDGVRVEAGFTGYTERQTTEPLMFTRRVHLYLEAEMTPEDRQSIVNQTLAMGFHVSVRDLEYARRRSEMEKPMAFISHDSRDKDAFVRELAHELIQNGCMVWYDEFTLKVGDSLRETIERGLRETKKCIVILSPNFLSNSGWGKVEFNSVFTREILEKQSVFLPVWLNVGAKEVYEYSPSLADKLGVSAQLGIPEVARRLAVSLRANS
ncbi:MULTISPECIES: toll/interleukin-1 receptor domain-containing protein [unclassified Variovorax]|uniref:toll/interleukin-1 receptor domain-containing protein n=1 Tax=unclassified Variovorax TaxID=663243 RepID=UPI001BD50A79|nr:MULTISPECIES: toll/interleukin-1 receptor domain-containing protein [unclassified Variovorax]